MPARTAAAAGSRATALPLSLALLALLSPQPSAAGETFKLCGGRSVSVPLLGTYSFQVTAVYQDEKFGFRCVRRAFQPLGLLLLLACLPASALSLGAGSAALLDAALTGRCARGNRTATCTLQTAMATVLLLQPARS
jgi:hypothetical protein